MAITVNDRIKLLRKELNLDADYIAQQLGISRATYYRYESKDIEKIPISALVPLAKVLQTTPAYLMGWEEKDHTTNQNIELTHHEKDFIKKYRVLDERGKSTVDRTLESEYEYIVNKNKATQNTAG